MKKIILSISFIAMTLLGTAQQNSQIDMLDVQKYVFDIEVFDGMDNIQATAEIKILVKSNTSLIFLDLINKSEGRGMLISELLLKNKAYPYKHKKDKIIIEKQGGWQKGEIVDLRIHYSGNPADGLIISKNKFGTQSFFSDNWPNRARNYLPVIDHPSDKALVEFIINCPEDYDVIASGVLQSTDHVKGGRKRKHYKTTQEIAIKVAVFAATKFTITEYDTIYGIPINSLIYAENTTGEMDYFSSTEAFRFYSDTIGPFIYDKLSNVQSKTRFGGMENAGNIFYFENSVNGNADYEDLIAHEVAHHWFGNAATEKDWHHIWLSEGFASYMADLYWEHKYGKEHMQDRLKSEREKVLQYSKEEPSPVVDLRITNWLQLLNPNSYEKGAWVLHMLREKTGDKIFFEILQSYYAEFKFSNALSSDFQHIAEEISGLDLTQFFNQWLYYPGNPELEIDWFQEEGKLFVRIEQMQKTKAFDVVLDISIDEELYALPIRNKIEYFSISIDKIKSEPVFDPEVTLLFSTEIRNLRFNPKNISFSKIESIKQLNRNYLLEQISNPIQIDIKQKALLKKGDLLFQDLDCGPLCDAIESVTQGFNGSDFSHVAMITEVNDENVIVFEAIGGQVRETKLVDFLKRSKDENGNPKVLVGRVDDELILENAAVEIKKYVGKAYDDVFDINNDSYYCSELLYFSFLDHQSEPIFQLFPMTFKRPDTGDFDPAWISYYKELAVEIPEGEPGLNPGGISRSPFVQIIYKFGNPSGYKEN
jgi:aminopeptidase N